MHTKLGLCGQSSDDSIAGEEDYYVRWMEWRSPDVVQRYELVKKAQTRLSKYGKRLPGNKFRNRKRRDNVGPSSRAPPAGLPINLYNPQWYMDLPERARIDLNAGEPIKFATAPTDNA